MKARYMLSAHVLFSGANLTDAGIIVCFLIFAVIPVSSLHYRAALRSGPALVLNTYCKRN